VKAALVLLLAGAFATGTSQTWTLERARHVLVNGSYLDVLHDVVL
jgi:hypothetical protein